MLTLATPESFAAENPPARIMGFESEHDIICPRGERVSQWLSLLTSETALETAGITAKVFNSGAWTSTGHRIYRDVGEHLEICTPESLGPLEATMTQHAGNILLSRLMAAAGQPFRIFRRSATVHPKTGEILTKGQHSNFCIPRNIADIKHCRLVESHLVTQLYAWGGIVTKDGYNIAPKAYDILKPTVSDLSNRTGSKKTMAIVPALGLDQDVNAARYDFGRFEDRTKTFGSPWSDFMGLATTSLLFRVLEHADMLAPQMRALQELTLKNPIHTFKAVAQDLSLTRTFELENGKHYRALDIQEGLSEIDRATCERLSLPADEIYAAQQRAAVCDLLRRYSRGESDLKSIERIGWAGKLWYLTEKLGEAAVQQGDVEALMHCLSWDRIHPRGGGQIYDAKRGVQLFTSQELDYYATNPPANTRARVRSLCIADQDISPMIKAIKWSEIGFHCLPLGTTTQQYAIDLHPYQTEYAEGILMPVAS